MLPLALAGALGGCAASMATGAVATVGIAARQERGMAAAMRDTRILAAIDGGLLRRDPALFAHVGVQAYEGRVLLCGVVDGPPARDAAIDLARNVDGVRLVIDEMEIAPDRGFGDYLRDGWISQQMQSKLLFDADVRSINYSILVVNRVIYILGVAQSAAELRHVLADAGDIAYVRRVASHVLLKDDPRRAL
jgi:osmotically-inducible protein OsmY